MSTEEMPTPEDERNAEEMFLEPARLGGVDYVLALMDAGRIDHIPESLKVESWKKTSKPYRELQVKGRYEEIFEIELAGWCHGIATFPGEIFPGIVFRIVKEMRNTWAQAVRQNLVFNLSEVACRLSKAAKYLVPERDIVLCILASLPSLSELDEEGQYIVAMLVDQAEQTYGGILDRLQRKWAREARKAA